MTTLPRNVTMTVSANRGAGGTAVAITTGARADQDTRDDPQPDRRGLQVGILPVRRRASVNGP
jgi:hypothetical protein